MASHNTDHTIEVNIDSTTNQLGLIPQRGFKRTNSDKDSGTVPTYTSNSQNFQYTDQPSLTHTWLLTLPSDILGHTYIPDNATAVQSQPTPHPFATRQTALHCLQLRVGGLSVTDVEWVVAAIGDVGVGWQ